MSQIAKHYELARHHELAGQSYDADEPPGVANGFAFEMVRLEKNNPVEFAITKRYLLRFIHEGATIVDVGVGVGHYSELLASRGSDIHLVDVAPRLLEAAQKRLTDAGFGQRIRSITHASATDLSFLPDASCDAVLMLGPFYHLSLLEERRQAAAEAWRILRKGGLLFAAGINRMTMLSWIYKDGAGDILEELEWLKPYVQTGNFPVSEPGVPSIIHLTTIAEFRADFTIFQERVLAGIESFAQGNEGNLLSLPSEKAQAWLDLIEETGRMTEGLGLTGHFLFIGQK